MKSIDLERDTVVSTICLLLEFATITFLVEFMLSLWRSDTELSVGDEPVPSVGRSSKKSDSGESEGGSDALAEDVPTVPSSPNPSLLSQTEPKISPDCQWMASRSDYRFARNVINDAGEPVQQLIDDVDKLAEKYNIGFEFVKTNLKNPKPADLRQKLLSKIAVPQQMVFMMLEMRQQVLKVLETLLLVIRSTDTPTPNLMAQMYELNNVIVIQTVKCRSARQSVSTLMCGSKEHVAFLRFLMNAHKHNKVEKLRYSYASRCPHIHQDLRNKWKPELLFDGEIQKRVFSATPASVTDGPSTFLMVPLVEMHLDRTKIVTQQSTNGNFTFILDVIPLEYADFLEAYLELDGLKRSDYWKYEGK